jgi:hypothetical protein
LEALPTIEQPSSLGGFWVADGMVVEVLALDIEYRSLQKDSMVGNSCLIAFCQEDAQEALIRFCATFETTDWSTAYSAAPWATENSAITVVIALSSKFSKSLMALAA